MTQICGSLLVAMFSPFSSVEGQEETAPYYVTMCSQGNQLGGQMIGYAVVLGYAWDHGLQPYFPKEKLTQIPGGQLNYDYIFKRLPQTLSPETILSDPVHLYSGYPIEYPGGNLCICGEPAYPLTYYNKYRDRIREMFGPSAEVIHEIRGKYAEILEHPKTVAVHVRAYDPNTHPHRCLGKNYFNEAMNRFPNDSLFVVFSDRIDWCKANLSTQDKNIIFIQGNNHVIDFYLMSLCKSIIISNSTYSWWAAFLKKEETGMILAPEIWFYFETPASRRTFYPDNFTTMPVEFPLEPDWSLLQYKSQSIGDT